MSAYATLVLAAEPPIARVTLSRPDKRNPIDALACGELIHALQVVAEEPALRVVVLTGAGDAFSAGGNLSSMGGDGGGNSPARPAALPALLTTMHQLGKPIIAMVNGHALGGGLGLMVACDLVVASDAASFGTTEIRLGLWPMMITAEIVRNIGRKQTLELMLTGKRIDAREAERIGLINRVVPAAELERETMALAGQIAEHSPATIALGLRSFYATQDRPYEEALAELEQQLGKVLALEDAREGVLAFLQKRRPLWKGR
jgi:enoyl-CoA hydratase/carnithine racemase